MMETLCSQQTGTAGEPLAGTALAADIWFLLQYDRPWSAQATTENHLPAAIQAWLNQQLAMVGNGRLQFIRQYPARPGIAFFVALTGPHRRLYRFQLESYDALLSLDIPAILRGADAYTAQRQTEPLYLICTNGKRDRCCALSGAAVYRELHPLVGPSVWQTTHLGGHRFAATGMAFPQGVCYGRLTPEMLLDWITAVSQDQLLLAHYRGNSHFSPRVQIADYFLRRETKDLNLPAYQFVSETETENGRWTIHFSDQQQNNHLIQLQLATPLHLFASCNSDKLKEITQYEMIAYQQFSHHSKP